MFNLSSIESTKAALMQAPFLRVISSGFPFSTVMPLASNFSFPSVATRQTEPERAVVTVFVSGSEASAIDWLSPK